MKDNQLDDIDRAILETIETYSPRTLEHNRFWLHMGYSRGEMTITIALDLDARNTEA